MKRKTRKGYIYKPSIPEEKEIVQDIDYLDKLSIAELQWLEDVCLLLYNRSGPFIQIINDYKLSVGIKSRERAPKAYDVKWDTPIIGAYTLRQFTLDSNARNLRQNDLYNGHNNIGTKTDKCYLRQCSLTNDHLKEQVEELSYTQQFFGDEGEDE